LGSEGLEKQSICLLPTKHRLEMLNFATNQQNHPPAGVSILYKNEILPIATV
jgi:hypothetical protein